MSRGFQQLEHTADRALEAWGETLEELFTAAAEGMFAESVNCAAAPSAREWEIAAVGEDLEGLLHRWLSELLWVAERDESIVCKIAVEELSEAPYRLRGRAWGGPPPENLPHTGAPVKAVTYHGLRIWQEQAPAEQGKWKARMVFDV